ncbi:hypothetical protein SORBI_3004G338600 [Sorghum bicolor]|uniref:Uncharacterized protein n=1 Tax=Sorghum bicolor TaxID=4558 RepID=A0A194YT17_SORBI|nr:hypothetical protein SORBI_3004G338600 [Sorghum bicolor]
MAALDTHSLAYIKGNQYLSFTYIIVIHGKVFMFGIRRHTNTSQLITFPWRNYPEWTSSRSLWSRLRLCWFLSQHTSRCSPTS